MAPNCLSLSFIEADGLVHPRHPCLTINSSILARHCPLDNGRHAINIDVNTAPRLGSLSVLPVELQNEVLRNMDIETLLVWRRVNKRAMDLVAGLMEWKKITTHAANTLRLSIGLKSHATFTLAELFSALCLQTCYDCGISTTRIDMRVALRLCLECWSRTFVHVREKKTYLAIAICLDRMMSHMRQRPDAISEKGGRARAEMGEVRDVRAPLDGDGGFVEAVWLDAKSMGTVG